MPFYDYKCPCCGAVEEHLQKHDDPAPHCEVCKLETSREVVMERQYSGNTGLKFNGWGWYDTDYKKKSGHYQG